MGCIRKNSRRNHLGFTLIEAMFAIMIIGLGVAALMHVFGSGTEINAYGDRMSKAVFLAGELRAMTDDVSFDQLSSYHGLTYSGVDAGGNTIAGMQDYQQTINVQMVNPADLTSYVGSDPQGAILTAVVAYNNAEITRMSWMRTP